MSSTKITSPASPCCFNSIVRGCHRPHLPQFGPYNLKTIQRLKKIDQSHHVFLKFSEKYGISRTTSVSSNIQPKASSSSSDSSSSPWKKWLLGVLFTVILPAVGHKGGLLLGLKGKIDQAIETVEHVTEVVEEIAEEAEKIVEEVEEKLPGDSKLKEALESFDDLAKMAVKEAKKAEDLVHKVKDVEEEIEDALLKAGKDEAKK
ncbi:uncharacterized protein LOC105176430 [Sesamum indicum]|uniref:Uncharacterized protein LOC105176430 n=1 Tax=Sesamum indicum TaxID=4182 RepID=A0A6I9URZ0_SESIN|nr:uncharacterized protein LOC105176430 [Sesamum indicum]